MKRLKRYTVSIVASMLLMTVRAFACGPYWYYPQDYYMFRVMDSSVRLDKDFTRANCLLWQSLTSRDISVTDIERVVYKYDLDQVESIMSGKHDKNLFCRWIRKNGDDEIVSFLALAKKCEKVRLERNSRWYYPTKEDEVNMSLEQVAETAMAYGGTRLMDRYALQAVRALYTLGRFSEMTSFWEGRAGYIPEGEVKDQAKGYVAGAYLKLGEKETALRMYQELDDVWSIVENFGMDGMSSLECLATYCPDSPKTRRYIQDMVSRLEPDHTDPDGHVARMHESKVTGHDIDGMIEICLRTPRQTNCRNKQLWFYTAAFLQDLKGDPESASMSLILAESSQGDEFMRESVKVMRIYLDAKLCSYDAAYEARLLSQLRWLDGKIRANITDKVRQETMDGYLLKQSFSYYYWNDMMRRVVLGEICPRMQERGMEVRALQLANYADNRLLDLVGKQMYQYYDYKEKKYVEKYYKTMAEYRREAPENYYDYSNYFFRMADDVEVSKLVSYVGRLDNPTTQLERFLNDRGYTSRDYLYELIGTRYLRCLDYSNAVRYLSKVSRSYQGMTNVSYYMCRMPFDLRQKDSKTIITDYKLSFAREMASLERTVRTSGDDDKVGAAMVRMGIGMRSSFGYCWALTRYGKSVSDRWPEEPYTKYVEAKAVSLIWEGLSRIKDREVAAQAYLAAQAYRTVALDYNDTPTGKVVASQCDKYSDYSAFAR